MNKVVIHSQNHSEMMKHVIKWLRDSYGSEIRFLEESEISSDRLDYVGTFLLILSHDPTEWDSLIRPLVDSKSKGRVVVCLDEAHTDHISKLLEAEVDDVILLPMPEKAFLRRIKTLFKSPRDESIDRLRKTMTDQSHGLYNFVGDSELFLDSIREISTMSKADTPVLITGESGTGKELCARGLHYLGNRANKPFIPVNCGAIPEHLYENELFGHERGAYTDASSNQRGLLTQVDGGTLFLDEVNSMTLSTQVKLLRFLEEGDYKPLGSSKHLYADVRIVCATNVDLQIEVKERRFREDLYYRLNVLNIDLPPLRSRRSDIRVLADHFLDKFASRHKEERMYLSKGALETLNGYDWPGNIRELSNVIERAVVKSYSSVLHSSDLSVSGRRELHEIATRTFREEREILLEGFEKKYLQRIMVENGSNVSRAANNAQIDRRTFQRMLKKHNISAAE